MKIETIRIYSEVLEQGIDFKGYIKEVGYKGRIINSYTKKGRGEFSKDDSLVDRIRKVKDVDVLITCIGDGKEIPLLMIEYSTAVPTDDHKMQRSDVYFWSAVFKTPVMKISPSTKGMGQGFGGGSKFTDEYEVAVAYRAGACFYPIEWETPIGKDVLPTKESALSCIYHSQEIKKVLCTLITEFNNSNSHNDYYCRIRNEYNKSYSCVINSPKYKGKGLRDIISNSTRFQWCGDRLCVKINRFGHAMDPDRGVLYFVNMLIGFENTTTEIQVNRSTISGRGGYNSLFDALARKDTLIKYVKNIYNNKNNIFTEKDAIYVFMHALNIEKSLTIEKVSNKKYRISDDALKQFLFNHPSMTAKSIFYLSSELRLTDTKRNPICSITWNKKSVDEYLKSVNTTNYRAISINPLSFEAAKEDIITFASVELYRRINIKLLAVSYPGAQGDRCILTGEGRSVLRTYVDIIAYNGKKDNAAIFLEECKDLLSKSISDVKKLNDIKDDPQKYAGLALLARKTEGITNISEVYISVGAKATRNSQKLDVDYIFMFDLDSKNGMTVINYSIGIVDIELTKIFLPLAEDGRHLKGKIEMEQIYVVA